MSTATRILILMAFYFIGGILGKESAFVRGTVSMVWPAFGIGLAAIVLFGYRYWPGVALGSVLYLIVNGTTAPILLGITAFGNAAGATVCAYLLERIAQFRPSLERVRDVAGLVALACALGTTVTAGFQVAAVCLAESGECEDLFSKLLEWWVPNAMAGLIVAPLIMVWTAPTASKWTPRIAIEALFCAIGLAIGTAISFHSWYVYGIENYPFAYLPYPFLVWGALRFGPRGAATGTAVVSALAIFALLDGRGPFVTSSERDSLMLIGSYLGILAVTNLLLAAGAAERAEAEREVRRSERRYRSVVNDQTELVWRFCADGTLTFVNQAYCRFHGKREKELLGTKYLPMLSDEDREVPLSYFGAMDPAEPVSYDYKLLLPSGEFVWQQCTTRRLVDDAGQTVEFQSVAQDITRRKQTEEEVKQAEQRLRAILNSMVDGVVAVDSSGKITSINRMAEQIFGRAAGAVLGHSISELFPEGDQRTYQDYLARHLREGQQRTTEMRALRADESIVPIDLAVSEVKIGGAPVLIVVVRDISERKRMEEQFRQSQKMDAIGRLAGGIAHDFNNLIQAIMGYTNLLLTRLGPDDAPRETIEQIEKSAERAAALTTQLLAFSRKQVLKPSLLSLNAVVGDMTRLLQRLIGADIQLITELHASPDLIRADPGQIEQLILNLAINARDAMPAGGRLLIHTSLEEMDTKLARFSQDFRPGKYVVLGITDSGCGMSPEVLLHLFEPFFTTKEPGKGTGLGLSIVYGIVKQNNAEISVNSDIGKGTAFRIFLPLASGSIEQRSEQAVPASDLNGKETVLLVEDGEIVRAMLMEVLQEKGYRVLEADDGENALDIAARHEGPIDLLVSDLVMPKLGGRELADRLLKCHPDLRVIYISGYSETEVIRYARGTVPVDFLQKPFRPESLLVKVRQILNTPVVKK